MWINTKISNVRQSGFRPQHEEYTTNNQSLSLAHSNAPLVTRKSCNMHRTIAPINVREGISKIPPAIDFDR